MIFPTNDKREFYRNEYLRSEHWRNLRKEKLSQVDHCEFCGSKNRIEPHHVYYSNLYDCTVDDLVVVCRKHHDIIHSALGMWDFLLKLDEKRKIRSKISRKFGPKKNTELSNFMREFWGYFLSDEFKTLSKSIGYDASIDILYDKGLLRLPGDMHLKIKRIVMNRIKES